MVQLPATGATPASSGTGIQLMREQKEFTINRDPTVGGFGFNVVGGTDRPQHPGHTGIFISRVRRPDLQGIKEGDQIIAVNGIKLEDKTHDQAVKILRDAVNNSTFLIELNSEQRIAFRVDYTAEDAMRTASLDGATETDESTSTLNQSLPSSSVSNASSTARTRTSSSTSTMNQCSLLDDGTVVRHTSTIEEDPPMARSRSASLSRAIRDHFSPSNPSLIMEVLFVSVGVIVIGAFVFFGIRRFRGTRI